jgi:hypothetical protein
MPIFRINTDLHYFAHVPKCGGTAVETYLNRRFGKMAFQEPIRPNVTQAQRWTRTMPQHVTAAELDLIIPRDWISSSFATVRHPVRRMISVFCFWRDHVRPCIPADADFNEWCAEAIPRMASDPFRYDGHLQPQTAFLPEGARIFRLEDGLEAIPLHIDSLTGTSNGPPDVPTMLVAKWRAAGTPPVPTEATLSLIAEAYAGDFARFGYEIPQSVAAVRALPDLPVLSATGKPPEPVKPSLRNRLYRNLMKRAGAG